MNEQSLEKKATIEDLQALREVVKGEKGELIKLVDVEVTKGILTDLANQYKSIQVNTSNYKKEAATAEKELRQTRYALQAVQKSNNALLNKAKKQQKDLFEQLINIIQPLENKIHTEISAVKKMVADEKRRKREQEEKRMEKIKDLLRHYEDTFLNFFKQNPDEGLLHRYDYQLKSLEADFDSFQELEFQAKRIHAIYTGRRKELLKKFQDAKDEQERKRALLKFRKEHLFKLGFEDVPDNRQMKHVAGFNITYNAIMEPDEVAWHGTINRLKQGIKEEQVKKQKEIMEPKDEEPLDEEQTKEAILVLRQKYELLLYQFKQLGGEGAKKLKKGEIPSLEDIKVITTLVKELRAQRQEDKKKVIREDVSKHQQKLLEFMEAFSKNVENDSFKDDISKVLLTHLIDNILTEINKAFGEIM